MKEGTIKVIEEFFVKHADLRPIKGNIVKAIEEMTKRILSGGKVMIAGNGGSAADCEHIVGEFLKEFYIKRPLSEEEKEELIKEYGEDGRYLAENLQGSIPAISLVSQSGIISAFANDAAADLCNAQQVYGYCEKRDIMIGISTSGNAKNVYYAMLIAKHKGALTIGMTGESGGRLKGNCDILLNVPAKETYLVQEYHLPVYHLICRGVEYEVFGK